MPTLKQDPQVPESRTGVQQCIRLLVLWPGGLPVVGVVSGKHEGLFFSEGSAWVRSPPEGQVDCWGVALGSPI